MTVFVKIPATNASEARQHYRRELARLKRLPRGDPSADYLVGYCAGFGQCLVALFGWRPELPSEPR